MASGPTLAERRFLPSHFWILGPAGDIAFILLTPVVMLLVFAVVRAYHLLGPFIALALVLSLGHYLPGMMRAYGDPLLFRRFRIRLIVAPVFFLALAAIFTYLDLHAVLLLMFLWGAWHWLMQIYGFARIYDAKVKSFSKTTSRLDYAMCVTWFVCSVTVLNAGGSAHLDRFYASGGPLVPGEAVQLLRHAWMALTLALTLLYAIHTIRMYRLGKPPNPIKILMLAITFVYLSYTTSVVDKPLAGFALFEACHDIQYLALVWIFNRNRAEKDPQAGTFIRFLFRKRGILVVVYIGMCVAFGCLHPLSGMFSDEMPAKAAVSVIYALAMLHYYLDGFIWKIREGSTRQSLGMQDGAGKVALAAEGSQPHLLPSWARHATLWLLFVAPVALLGMLESTAPVADQLERARNLVEAFPKSSSNYLNLCGVLIDRDQTEEALHTCLKAVRLAPKWDQAHFWTGRVLAERKAWEEAEKHFQTAISRDPRNAEAHFYLGVISSGKDNLEKAASHFERALQYQPDLEEAHYNLGGVFAKQGKGNAARTQYEKALRLDPSHVEAHISLGILHAEQHDLVRARDHFQRAVEINPQYAKAHQQLGFLFHRQGILVKAASHLQRAVGLQPDLIEAQYHLGLVFAEQGKREAAKTQYENVIRLDPSDVATHINLGVFLAQEGDLAQARSHFERVLEIDPNLIPPRRNLALVLMGLRKAALAKAEYERVLMISPNDVGAQNKLAWLLATCPDADVRDGAEAVRLAEQACRTTGNSLPKTLDTLAAAYAEAERFEEAVTTAEKALELARTQSQMELADQLKERIRLYRNNRPFRTP